MVKMNFEHFLGKLRNQYTVSQCITDLWNFLGTQSCLIVQHTADEQASLDLGNILRQKYYCYFLNLFLTEG